MDSQLQNQTPSKSCTDCGGALPLGCSPKRMRCDGCKRKEKVSRVARWRAENPEKASALRETEKPANRVRASAWYEANTERHRAAAKAWSEARPEKNREYHATWLAKPGNKAKASAWVTACVKAHPEKMAVYQHRWYIENADTLREVKRERARLYAASEFAFEDWLMILEVFGHRCAYCNGANLKLTMDHVIAISRGGEHTVENIIPACKSCNSRKYNRPIWVMVGKAA